ncbi:hypothetical protein PQQ51_27620 [Paraburkholderia xenovorans]|uniref:O-linked N-acetylglucosamine transferase family protein n=1 Tax=Paraburkholderia xenovorans TaxID=36873 RepID=UPI0038BD9BB1
MFPELSSYLDVRLSGRNKNAVDPERVLELGTFVADMPDRNKLLVWMLRDLLESSMTAELQQLAEHVLKCGLPDDAELLFVLGLAFERCERNQDGLDCIEKAIQLDSSVAMYHNNAGVFYERLGQYEFAKAAYARAMTLNPGDALHAINLGKLCINRLNCFEDGIRSYNAALALNLEDVGTIRRLAMAYYKYGFVEKAIAQMRLAVRIAPTNIAGIFFKLILHLTVSYESTEHLLRSREAVVKELDVIHDEVTTALAMPGYAAQSFEEDGWVTPFLLAYHGKNDKEIMQRYSAELTKAQFGLSESDVVLLSPQSLFKYLPENDDIYAEIALRVNNAKFVFISEDGQKGRKEFVDRLTTVFERRGLEFGRHIIFIPSQGKAGFMQACNMADLFIDNLSWSGHNTVLDALHSRTPVITLRGNAMRKNHGAAILTQIGLGDFVVKTREEFVEKCVSFARSPVYKAMFDGIIEEGLRRLLDRSPVDGLEAFMSERVGLGNERYF